MFDYEWAVAQHHLNCRLANRVLVPDAIPAERLARYGVKPPKLVRYPGPQGGVLPRRLRARPGRARGARRHPGVDPRRRPHRALVRDATSAARRARSSPACSRGSPRDERTQTVVLARTAEQREATRALGLPRVVVPERAVDGRTLVAYADLLVSAGGTMNREAAVLGTPVWSVFEGRLGAVDERLAAEGRLRFLTDPGSSRSPRSPRTRGATGFSRDPRDLLSARLSPLAPRCAIQTPTSTIAAATAERGRQPLVEHERGERDARDRLDELDRRDPLDAAVGERPVPADVADDRRERPRGRGRRPRPARRRAGAPSAATRPSPSGATSTAPMTTPQNVVAAAAVARLAEQRARDVAERHDQRGREDEQVAAEGRLRVSSAGAQDRPSPPRPTSATPQPSIQRSRRPLAPRRARRTRR